MPLWHDAQEPGSTPRVIEQRAGETHGGYGRRCTAASPAECDADIVTALIRLPGPWQIAQALGVPFKMPRTWQSSQRADSCAPVSGKPVARCCCQRVRHAARRLRRRLRRPRRPVAIATSIAAGNAAGAPPPERVSEERPSATQSSRSRPRPGGCDPATTTAGELLRPSGLISRQLESRGTDRTARRIARRGYHRSDDRRRRSSPEARPCCRRAACGRTTHAAARCAPSSANFVRFA